VTLIFQDKGRHTAKVIGRDEKTDIALLKINTNQKPPYVTWGKSDNAEVGGWVVAVGNPFGPGGSVAAGIISTLGCDINEGPMMISCKSTHRSAEATPAHSVGIGFAVPSTADSPAASAR